MTGPLAKADALLAARLAPWLELSARKAPAGADAAPPVAKAPRVDNEVLLPARASLHPQYAAQLRAALPAAAPNGDAGGAGIALSSAARAIFALASDTDAGEAAAVRGSVALWPAAQQAPAADALASALSRQVSESGLFYEAHLAEFAAGARSLAQMQREPQAGLAQGPGATGHEAQATAQPQPQQLQQHQQAGVLSVAAAQAPAVAVPASPASAVAALMTEMPLPQASPADAPHAAAAAAVIHPQAAALVHQQLDLLACSMLRWTGEAWPGVPMEWTVQEDAARQQADEAEHGPLHWSTTLSLDLPRLGEVKVALKLDGSSVHAQLAATQAPTTDLLRSGAQALTRRMSDAGLALQSLALGPEAAVP